MGSFIAQELALKSPDRVNNLILYASICGSNETILSSPEVTQMFDAIANSKVIFLYSLLTYNSI
jgi:hypothetical protein